MTKKKIGIVIALFLLVAALLTAYFVTRPDTTEGMKSFTLTVVHKDGTTKEFPLKSDKEYLGEALQAENLIQGEQSQYGLYILEVDGEEAIFERDGAYWSFYVGEEYATQGIDQTPIEDGKAYKLVYTVDSMS